MHTRPDRDGEDHLRLLGAAWEETARHWQDEVARQFDTDRWTPLARQSRNYLEALAAMMDLLEAAERDTELLRRRHCLCAQVGDARQGVDLGQDQVLPDGPFC